MLREVILPRLRVSREGEGESGLDSLDRVDIGPWRGTDSCACWFMMTPIAPGPSAALMPMLSGAFS